MEHNARLQKGNIYENKGGGRFLCLESTERGITTLRNIASSWTLRAHCVTKYDDGKIEWDFSSGGYFAET